MFTRDLDGIRTSASYSLRLILIVLITASFCVQGIAAQTRSVPSALVARARQVTGDNFQVLTSTPRGVTVVARTVPRAEVLQAIDQGFGELFAVASRHRYRARLNYSDYTVFIGRPDRTKDSGGRYSPDIAVGAGQYAGSDYDQGGFVYAAGMVLAYNPSAFVIAEHDRDFGRIANVVRYEGEHLILYYNNRALYEKTADHSRGGSHPILQ
ncbi:MAG: hypothetical protein QOE77_1591 [Blastocatellia bacterium]|jgi:hypothetical protein|nr:hypothetical protein [Blastocatellia bacterium]